MRLKNKSRTRLAFRKPLSGFLLAVLFLFGSFAPYFAQVAHARTDTGGGGTAGNNRVTDDCRSYNDTTQYLQCLSIFGSGADKLIADFKDQLRKANSVEEVKSLLGVPGTDGKAALVYRNVINNKEWVIPTHSFKEDDEGAYQSYLGTDGGRVRDVLEKAKNYRTDVFVGHKEDYSADEYVYPDKGTYTKLYLKGGFYLDADTTKILDDLNVKDGLVRGAAGSVTPLGPIGGMAGFFSANVNWFAGLAGLGGTNDLVLWVYESNDNEHIYATNQCHSNGGNVDSGDQIGVLTTGSAFAFQTQTPSIDGSDGELSEDERDQIVPNEALIGARSINLNSETRSLEEGRPFYFTAQSWFLCDKSSTKEEFIEFCTSKFSEEKCIFDERTWADALIGSPIQKALSWARDGANALMVLSTNAVETVITATNLGSFPGLLSGWKTMRDLANLVFVLLLSAIAFASILRIDTERYGVRRLLPRLIFAVIAVNFSLLFVIMVTNVAQVLSQPFLGAVRTLLNSNPADNPDTFANLGDIGAALIGILLIVVIAIVLALLALLFIVRIMILLILGALGPMAVLFAVMPLSTGLAKSWLTNLLKWAMMAPASLVIIYLGANFTRTANNFGNDLLQTGVFLIAVIGAIFIPLEMGGRVMSSVQKGVNKTGSKAYGGGRAVGGFAARQSGLSAAWEQQKAKSERTQAERGSRIRQRVAGGVSRASRGRFGTSTAAEAQMQLAGHEQEEAQLYSGKFDAKELAEMRDSFPPNHQMRKTLDMAHDMRTGKFQEGQKADQQGTAGYLALDDAGRARRLSGIGDRNVKQEQPEFIQHLANTGEIGRLPSSALRGILEHNDPGQIAALRSAHRAGHITDKQRGGLSEKDRELYNHRIVKALDTSPPEKPDRPDVREQLPIDYNVDDERDQSGL